MTQQTSQPHPPSALPDAMDGLADTTDTDATTENLPDDQPMRLGSDGTETEDDDRMEGGATPPRIYPLPPHIAARFYRSSASTAAQAARRKSSAASSRRNSISSTHSRSSHGYGVDTSAPQSKHVAQHLRRASILADRKARLADRAAHAEQVRLRAALAKAATRDISLSEERAQAAAQAREKNLAEIAATCAEEVKRAKAIAESIKEKREQNLQRLRQQIQGRLDDAERRREELRRNNAAGRSTRTRGQSLANNGDQQVEVMPQVAEVAEQKASSSLSSSPVADRAEAANPLASADGEDTDGQGVPRAAATEIGRGDASAQTSSSSPASPPVLQAPPPPPPPALTPDEAACKILHWWRKAHRRKAIAAFRQLGLSVDGVQKRSFTEVVDLLARESVLMTTAKVLRLCGIREGKTSSVKEVAVVRAFLSAFLILGHPTHVLSDNGGVIPAAPPPGSVGHPIPIAAGAAQPHSSPHHQQEQVGLPTTSATATTTAVAAPLGDTDPATDLDLANPQLQELVGKAKDLLIRFETIVSRLSPATRYTPSAAAAGELVEAYDRFYDAFIAWKARDASALVEVMVLQFVELDAIWQTVKDSTETAVSATYRQSIQQNQLLLMVRIKKLAGAEAGKKKVFEAVRKARRTKAEAKKKAAAATTNMRPREADESTIIETAMGDLTGEDNSHGGGGGSGSGSQAKSAVSSKAPTATPSSAASSLAGSGATASTAASTATATATGAGAATGAAASVVHDAAFARLLPQDKLFSEARAEAKLHLLRSDVPNGNRGIGGSEAYETTPLPDNRTLVHELAINSEFRISSTVFPERQAAWMAPIFARMRKTMPTGGGGDSSREQENEHFYYLLTMADVIRTKLERLTVPGKRMHQFIGELLDTEVAQRQFAVGSFSYERFFASVGQLLPQLCAPVRDAEVQELVEVKLQQGDYVDRLQALLYVVDVMLTDHINFMISVAAPRLLPSAAGYETRRFSESVERWSRQAAQDGDDEDTRLMKALPAATRSWWAAQRKVHAEAARRDPEGVQLARVGGPTPDQVYSQMLVDVFTQVGGSVPMTAVPEMLWMDYDRVRWCGAATRRIVTAGAVLLQAKNLLKRDVRLPWKTEGRRVMAVLERADGEGEMAAAAAADEKAGAAVRVGILSADGVVDGMMAALECGRAMPAATQAALRGLVERTLGASAQASATGTVAEPVLRLLVHRLRTYLRARLAGTTGATGATGPTRQTSAAAGERLTQLGLAEFGEEVRELAEVVGRVGMVDRAAHGTFWEQVGRAVEGVVDRTVAEA